MRLIREQRAGVWAIEDDAFAHVPDDVAEVPPGDVIVGWARWRRERDALRARRGRLGVRVPPDVKAEVVAADAEGLAVIAIEFPKLGDGRGYSTARLLRERHRYAGELRAIGNVLRDQLQAMARCGISAFEIDPSKSVEAALSGLSDFSVLYQPAADEKLPLWKRHARAWPRAGTSGDR